MKCFKCGQCCWMSTIALTDEDVERISKNTTISFYRVRVTGAKVLNWKPYKDSHCCVFFDPKSCICTIYELRPYICQEFFCYKVYKSNTDDASLDKIENS